MAACRWAFRKGGLASVFLIFFTWLSFTSDSSFASTTTESVTSDAATNDTTTAAPTTTTTQAQTTTLPTAQPQSSNFQQNTDLGPCPCDLTANGCDVNCCCDEDCSTGDRNAFAMCLPNSYLSKTDDRVCLKRDVVIIENTPFESNTTADGLFCVYYDNYPQRNFYIIPDVFTEDDGERLDSYINRYGGPSFQEQNRVDPRDFETIYKSGDVIYTVYENSAIGSLGLPTALHASVCTDNNPAAFLYDQTSNCVRDVTDLASTCQTLAAINASTYFEGFKVVVTPSLFRNYVPGNGTENSGSDSQGSSDLAVVTITAPPSLLFSSSSTSSTTSSSSTTSTPASPVASPAYTPLLQLISDLCDVLVVNDLFNNSCVLNIIPQSPHMCVSSPGGIPVYCNDTPGPQYDPSTGECRNAVTQVQYIITTNGTKGITSVEVKFVFTTLTQSDLPIVQTFITKFEGLGETNPVARSGNPGYVVGQPVLAGMVVRQTDTESGTIKLAIQQNGTSPEENSLTIIRTSPSGNCGIGTGDRTPVLFGEDMRSGCFISFNMSDMNAGCRRMQEIALLALWPYGPEPPRNWSVATFGNSDPHTVGDWVTILVQNSPRPAVPGNGAECLDMVLGMHIQILYANVGSLSNPQPKIVGVSFVYENSQTIAFQCIGQYCQPGSESAVQRFEVVQSVSFIDVSQPAAEITAEAPLFLAKVPYDFFYPFGLGSGSSVKTPTLLSILCTALSIALNIVLKNLYL